MKINQLSWNELRDLEGRVQIAKDAARRRERDAILKQLRELGFKPREPRGCVKPVHPAPAAKWGKPGRPPKWFTEGRPQP